MQVNRFSFPIPSGLTLSIEGARTLLVFNARRNFQHGTDGWWLDATEPEFDILKDKPTYLGAGNYVRNAYPCLLPRPYMRAARDRPRSTRRDSDPVRLPRPTEKRGSYMVGDIEASWAVFRKQISAGLNLTMSGIPYWTTM